MKTLAKFLHLRLQGCSSPDLPLYNNMLSKPEAPTPPNYLGAAQQQGVENLGAGVSTSVLNRPNEVNPFASRTWNQTGDVNGVPQFTATTNFSPEMKGVMDPAFANERAAISKPLDFSNGRDAIVDAMYRRSTRMLDPRFEQQEDKTRTDLANRGFSLGDEGYSRAMGNFNREKEFAYGQAMDQANTNGAAQRIQELLAERRVPLEELNALRTGSMPFQPYGGAGTVGPAPVMAATQAQGNAALTGYGIASGNSNNQMNGLFGLGAAGINAGWDPTKMLGGGSPGGAPVGMGGGGYAGLMGGSAATGEALGGMSFADMLAAGMMAV